MKFINKIRLIVIVTIVGIAGYILIKKYCKMSELENIKIQKMINPYW